MRGWFSAGVMDVMMEHGIRVDGIVGVSAGASFGCNYKSHQIGRVLRYNVRFKDDPRYMGLRSLLRTGDLVAPVSRLQIVCFLKTANLQSSVSFSKGLSALSWLHPQPSQEVGAFGFGKRKKGRWDPEILFDSHSPSVWPLVPGAYPVLTCLSYLRFLPEPFQTLPGPAPTLGFQNSSTVG